MKQAYSEIKSSIGNFSIMFDLWTYLNQKIDGWLLYQVPIYPPGRGSSAEKITNFKQRLHRTVDNKETIEMC